MALVQMFGVQRLGFGTGMQQRFVDPALLTQLLDLAVGRRSRTMAASNNAAERV